MDKFIIRMQVVEVSLKEMKDWSEGFEEEDTLEDKTYELFFATTDEMIIKLDEITEGYHQHLYDVSYDMYASNLEEFIYYSNKDKWNKEIHIQTSAIYITDSLLEAIHKVNH